MDLLGWMELTAGVAQMLPNGGSNADESIEFLVERTVLGLEVGFYFGG